jgi:hypothetical protein
MELLKTDIKRFRNEYKEPQLNGVIKHHIRHVARWELPKLTFHELNEVCTRLYDELMNDEQLSLF